MASRALYSFLEQTNKEASKAVQDQDHKELNDLRARVTELEAQLVTEKENASKQAESLRGEIQQAKDEATAAIAAAKQHEHELSLANEKIQELTNDVEQANSNAAAEQQRLQEQISSLNAQLEESRSSAAQASELAQKQHDDALTAAKAEALLQETQQREEFEKKLAEREAEAAEKIRALETSSAEATAAVATFETQLQEKLVLETELRADITSAHSKIAVLETALASVQKEKDEFEQRVAAEREEAMSKDKKHKHKHDKHHKSDAASSAASGESAASESHSTGDEDHKKDRRKSRFLGAISLGSKKDK